MLPQAYLISAWKYAIFKSEDTPIVIQSSLNILKLLITLQSVILVSPFQLAFGSSRNLKHCRNLMQRSPFATHGESSSVPLLREASYLWWEIWTVATAQDMASDCRVMERRRCTGKKSPRFSDSRDCKDSNPKPSRRTQWAYFKCVIYP